MSVSACITNIARGSLHDGPGVRTVVYFKGCTLRCLWCHNPETLSARKQILYMPQKCIHCGSCIEVCPKHHIIADNGMAFLHEACAACGKCAEGCPSLALSLCGEDKTAEELFEDIKKDSHYYIYSGGGVTFSGGECLLYPDFIAEITQKCQKNGIHVAIETAAFVPWENFEKLLPCVDLFFVDLKIPDREKHKTFTGQYNDRIIENLQRLSKEHNHIIVRIPMIPGVNDSAEDIEGFAAIINTLGNGIREVELLKYNHLAESKYQFTGRTYTKFAKQNQCNEEMERLCSSLAKKINLHCYFVE